MGRSLLEIEKEALIRDGGPNFQLYLKKEQPEPDKGKLST